DSIVKGRAVDVELYASQLDLSSQLGPEHCSSEQIRSVFILNPSAWNYCGKTKPHAHLPGRYKITTEFGNCNAASAPSADIKFTFESPDASTHLCRASDSNGKQLKITAVKNPTCDVADNVLRSQWLCSNCSSSANVSVICQADSQHQVKQFITTDCAKSTAVPSQPMTDLNRDAEQAGAATTTANVAQPSISMQAAAADEFYINSKLF
uniref:Ricin B-type lectin domain-containing protein n=1 Tax=Macrostomum lignano TaxID=282301 RepID=A0A1I8HS94_9PLAT